MTTTTTTDHDHAAIAADLAAIKDALADQRRAMDAEFAAQARRMEEFRDGLARLVGSMCRGGGLHADAPPADPAAAGLTEAEQWARGAYAGEAVGRGH